jgi:hypothetical protein
MLDFSYPLFFLTLKVIDEDSYAIGIQALVAFLQATVAYQYRQEAFEMNDFVTNKISDVAQAEDPNQNDDDKDSWFNSIRQLFNAKTKIYVSVVEKSVKGVLELAKALGEIGAMTDRRRSFRKLSRVNNDP